MNSATRIKLSVMMFLEYAIWSVWALMLYARNPVSVHLFEQEW
jgi:hypothetical protein